MDGLSASDVLGQTTNAGAQAGDHSIGVESSQATGGGTGKVTAWSRPDLVIAAPGGIASFTPGISVMAAGHTLTLVAGQALQLAVQGHDATAIKSGLVFYTSGKAGNPGKPIICSSFAAQFVVDARGDWHQDVVKGVQTNSA